MRWMIVPSHIALKGPGARKGEGGAFSAMRSATSRAGRVSDAPLDSSVSFRPGAGPVDSAANDGAKPQATAKTRQQNESFMRRKSTGGCRYRAAAAVVGVFGVFVPPPGTLLIVL